jgi:ABC-type phosphate transport system substrate-binding protein
MKKQIVSVVALAGLSAASLAGAADINIFGASAQFDFLNANAVKFVQQYCTVANPSVATGNGYVIQYKTIAGNTIKNGVVTGTSCGTAFGKPAIPGSTDNFLTFRYNGIASGEGVQSINKTTPIDPDLADSCTAGSGFRLQAPAGLAASADYTTSNPGDLAFYKTKTACAKVDIGTSDVAWDQFDQFASDELVSATGLNTIPLLPTFTAPANAGQSTVAVPFAFYVNPGVTATHCVADLVSLKKTGGLCTTAGVNGATVTNTEQCSTGSVCETTPTTIDTISRLQANILFNGAILDWKQLGQYFTANPIKLCMRKPGSGTHVAFDKTVMRAAGKTGWGADYNTLANNEQGNALPYTNFNGSSTDQKKCISGTDGLKRADGVTLVPATGAIGYLDADTANGTTAGSNDYYTRVRYNGVSANRTNVRNGAYEFYTVGQMYPAGVNSALENAVIAYVQSPANIPGSKAAFWATNSEMVYKRGSDPAYPSKVLDVSVTKP